MQNKVQSEEYVRLSERVKDMVYRYFNVELLIRVGEYEKGNDLETDEAIDRYPHIMSFLKQGFDGVEYEQTLEAMEEFGQLIDIVDIRIGKQQRKLVKLKKQYQELLNIIEQKWQQIEQHQQHLKALNVKDEPNALRLLFMRRESTKSAIESLFFDASVNRQDAEEVALEIAEVEAEKRRLEKRKDALGELREELRYVKS